MRIASKKTKVKFMDNLTFTEIKKELINKTGIDFDTLSRERPLPYIRAVYFKLCRELKPLASLQNIADSLQYIKNHATVIHGINKLFPEVMQYERDILQIYNEVYYDLSQKNKSKKNIVVYNVDLKNNILIC